MRTHVLRGTRSAEVGGLEIRPPLPQGLDGEGQEPCVQGQNRLFQAHTFSGKKWIFLGKFIDAANKDVCLGMRLTNFETGLFDRPSSSCED